MIYNIKQDLKRLWDDTCSIYIYSKTINESTKRTEFGETLIYSNEPCKLSFNSNTLNNITEVDHVSEDYQDAKLFIDNELDIPMGSKVVVIRGERTFTYKVGEIAVFTSHQELRLTLFDRWV